MKYALKYIEIEDKMFYLLSESASHDFLMVLSVFSLLSFPTSFGTIISSWETLLLASTFHYKNSLLEVLAKSRQSFMLAG